MIIKCAIAILTLYSVTSLPSHQRVFLYHSFLYSSLNPYVDLFGSVAMPLFFALSGFSLAIVYGQKDLSSNFEKRVFLQNRFARVYPSYILTTLISFPQIWTGIAALEASILFSSPQYWATIIFANIFCVQSWLVGAPIYPTEGFNPVEASFNVPAWFVSVLVFQYLLFPFSIRLYRKLSRRWFWIAVHVLLCMAVSTVIYYYSPNYPGLAMSNATTNLLTSGFFMFHAGILLGFITEDTNKTIVESDASNIDNEENASVMNKKREKRWAVATDVCTLVICVVLLICSFLAGFGYSEFSATSFWAQIYFIPLMFVIMVGTCLDGRRAILSRLLLTRPMLWCGTISMSLYLTHTPIIRWFAAIYEASSLMVTGGLLGGQSTPWWSILITTPVCLVAAYLWENFVDTPCRNWLRYDGKRKNDSRGNANDEEQGSTATDEDTDEDY